MAVEAKKTAYPDNEEDIEWKGEKGMGTIII